MSFVIKKSSYGGNVASTCTYFIENNDWLKSETFLSAYTNDCFSGSICDCCFQSLGITAVSMAKCLSIGNSAFARCISLNSASFPKCQYIGSRAFYYCYLMRSIYFPKCKYLSDYAFYYCQSLDDVSFPLASIIGAGAFQCCYNLLAASFPKCTMIGAGAFYNNYALSNLYFPLCQTIDAVAFGMCSSLAFASFPSVTEIFHYAFSGCTKLLSFYILGSSFVSASPSVFESTPIAGYTEYTSGVYGSVFVPSDLYSTYISASNWSEYANRIVPV